MHLLHQFLLSKTKVTEHYLEVLLELPLSASVVKHPLQAAVRFDAGAAHDSPVPCQHVVWYPKVVQGNLDLRGAEASQTIGVGVRDLVLTLLNEVGDILPPVVVP